MRETEMEEEEEERPMPASLSSFLWFHLLMLARPPHFSGKLLEGWQGGRGKEGGPFARAGRLAGWLSYAVSKPITRMPSGPARRQCSGGWPTSLRSISVVGVVVVLGGVGCRGERESARRQTGLMGRFLPPRREKRAAKAKWHRAAAEIAAAAEFRN